MFCLHFFNFSIEVDLDAPSLQHNIFNAATNNSFPHTKIICAGPRPEKCTGKVILNPIELSFQFYCPCHLAPVARETYDTQRFSAFPKFDTNNIQSIYAHFKVGTKVKKRFRVPI